jgi:uncharacterized protein DUF3943
MGPVKLWGSGFLTAVCWLGTPTHLVSQQFDSVKTNPWHAAMGVLSLNTVPWAYNWYVHRSPWANISWQSWKENLRLGFMWDDNGFSDNQLAHPYHGSLYFHSARASGYGFWGSLPFVAAGSAGWELLFEKVRPSINDFVNTTLGGLAIGEVTFRLSSLLGLSAGARGTPFARQAAAFALSPIGATQALVHGRRQSPEVSSELRKEDAAWLALGRHAGHAYLGLSYQYGSPFSELASRPYDVFEFTMQLGTQSGVAIKDVGISGLLARRGLHRSERSKLVLGLYQHYDYRDLPRLEMGSQSLSGALLYQRNFGSHTQLRINTHLEAVLLGAISSDHGHALRRDYDYGCGGGGRITTALRHRGYDLLRFDARTVWLHSLYGAAADHVATSWRLGTAIRLGRIFALGGDVGAIARRSWYSAMPARSSRVGETRVYLIWPTN